MANNITKTPNMKHESKNLHLQNISLPRKAEEGGTTNIKDPRSGAATQRYQSQIRSNVNKTALEKSLVRNNGEVSRDVKDRGLSHISRDSGTNISFSSSYSAIKTNIARFKNKNKNAKAAEI